jgi:surface polysaccharide O-acyltransferase-like enzyme
MADGMTAKPRRQLNYELLRIIAMLMIVCLHYLSKGGILGSPSRNDMTATGYTAWLIEALCLVAVNAYVLISGYFGVEASGSGLETEKVLKRPFKIWKQVLFYSVVIGIIALITGIQQFDIYQIFGYIFPIVTEHYWFATAYIFLCLIMPFLNRGIESMGSKQLGYIISAMLLFFSIAKTFIPMHLPWDFSGYDVLWFTALYLTGAYIRKYGAGVLSKGVRAVGIYLISTLVIFISFIVIRLIYLKTGKLEDFISYGYSYNYLFCYTGAIGLFVAFGRLKTGGLEKLRKIIELLSGATFGVYLIHEHINIRYLWPTWFATDKVATLPVPLFLISMLGTVVVVYLGCSLIEILRATLSRFITKKVGKR